MWTTTHRGSIGMSRITISAQDWQYHRPLTLMLLIRTLQGWSPRWVRRNTLSTSFTGSRGTTTGNSSWSSWSTNLPWWLPRPMRSSPTSSKSNVQSRDRLGSLQKLWSRQRKVVQAAERARSAKVQRQSREIIREIIRTIRKRKIYQSDFICNSDGISPRTVWASNPAFIQKVLTLQQNHRQRSLRMSPLGWRTIGRWVAEMVHPVIGSFIPDAWLKSLAIDQSSLRTHNIL